MPQVPIRVLLPEGEPLQLALPPLSLASLISLIASHTESRPESIRLTYRDAQNQRMMLNGESRYQEALQTLQGRTLQATVVVVPDSSSPQRLGLSLSSTDLDLMETTPTNRTLSGQFSLDFSLEPEKELQRRVASMLGNAQHYFSSKFKALLFTLSSTSPSSIHELELSEAQIGTYECVLLSEIVELLPELKVLHLQGNSIGNGGVTQLCDSLRRHRTIQYLDLSENQLSGKGLKALANMIRAMPELELLAVARNQLDRTDLDYLLDAAPPRCRIHHDANRSCEVL